MAKCFSLEIIFENRISKDRFPKFLEHNLVGNFYGFKIISSKTVQQKFS